MDENLRDKTESVLPATENKLWLPPLSPKDQEKLNHEQHNQRKAIIKETGFSGKTLWNWLQLLIVPLMLAGGGLWFTSQQNLTSLQLSQRQHDTDIQLVNDQQRETTLKTYLDDMSDLLLNHHLRQSKPGEEVSRIARERTLTTLRRLDAPRNRIVLQFLQDEQLIGVKNPVIDLSGVSHAGVDLSGANLSGADLSGVDLSGVDLSNATLSRADLQWVTLSRATLSGTDLSDANLSGARVTQEQLAQARSLEGATMPDGSKHP